MAPTRLSPLPLPTLLLLLAVGLVATSIPRVLAKPSYSARLPNGAHAPGSRALGHVNVNGTGALNAFGRHFIFATRTWTVELCERDSDGDGQTNGQELGDPCCEWTVGATPRYTEGLSHPGNKAHTANESLWMNLTCPNTTTLTEAVRSPAWRTTASRRVFLFLLLATVVEVAASILV